MDLELTCYWLQPGDSVFHLKSFLWDKGCVPSTLLSMVSDCRSNMETAEVKVLWLSLSVITLIVEYRTKLKQK